MSEQSVVAAKAPIKIAVEAGKDYWWCACGKSAKQPFCDGSHKGGSFSPMKNAILYRQLTIGEKNEAGSPGIKPAPAAASVASPPA